MIITIDGSAGSGKTSAAHALAEALDLRLLHTGAMYRAAAVALTLSGIDIDCDQRDICKIESVVSAFRFEMPGDETILNGVNLTSILNSEDAGKAASRVGTFPEVRTKLKAEQRRLAAGQDTICEGRDQGTSVFPDAPVKFFFEASLEVRTERRIAQLLKGYIAFDPAQIRDQIAARDRQDRERPLDPLKKADDAIVIDTSSLAPDEVLNRMIAVVKACRSRG